MTENKRFKYSYSLEKVYDCDSFNGETTESYGTFECCDLLNKLNDENKELKQIIVKDTIPRLINGFEKSYKDLEEENEQLKFQNSNLMKEVAEYSRKAKELEKENEQLKKILNELSDMLQFDVENGIRSYPVKLSEYLSNALKELQRND